MVVEKAEKDTLKTLVSGVYTDAKFGSFGKGYVERVSESTGIEPKKIIEGSVIQAMNQLAEDGNDRNAFNAIANSLGDEYRVSIADATRKLDARERTIQLEVAEETRRGLQNSLDRWNAGEASYESYQQELQDAFDSGRISETDLRTYRNLAENIQDKRDAALYKAEYQKQVATITESDVQSFAGGTGGSIGDIEVYRDPETKETITADKRRLNAWRASVAAIDGDATLTPSQKEQAIIAVARTNQYEPPEWKSKIEGMNTSFNVLSFSMKPVDPVEIRNNQALVNTVTFYATLKEQHPGYVAKLDQDVQMRMNGIMEEMQIGRKPPEVAIHDVLRGERNIKNLTPTDRDNINTYAKDIATDGSNPRNLGEWTRVVSEMIMRQMRYTNELGIARDNVEKMIDASKMKIDGVALLYPGDTAAGMERGLFAKSATKWIDENRDRFMKLNPGMSSDTLSVAYDRDNDTWRVFDQSANRQTQSIVIDDKGTQAFFSTKQLTDLLRRENYERGKREASRDTSVERKRLSDMSRKRFGGLE
jgi:hypothetical protein